ncbi:hypothetical protein [Lysobacter gummosus]
MRARRQQGDGDKGDRKTGRHHRSASDSGDSDPRCCEQNRAT